MVVFSDHDQRQSLDGRKVKPFVKSAGAHPAIADIGHRDNLFLLHPRAKQVFRSSPESCRRDVRLGQ